VEAYVGRRRESRVRHAYGERTVGHRAADRPVDHLAAASGLEGDRHTIIIGRLEAHLAGGQFLAEGVLHIRGGNGDKVLASSHNPAKRDASHKREAQTS
jgi:hypothetical protein